jgi:hypothetical protein
LQKVGAARRAARYRATRRVAPTIGFTRLAAGAFYETIRIQPGKKANGTGTKPNLPGSDFLSREKRFRKKSLHAARSALAGGFYETIVPGTHDEVIRKGMETFRGRSFRIPGSGVFISGRVNFRCKRLPEIGLP